MNLALFIFKVLPEPDSSAAGIRILQLIGIMRKAGYRIVTASAAPAGEFSVKDLNGDIEHHLVAPNDPSFDKLVRSLSPKVVVFDRFSTEEQFGWRVAECCPDALRVLDTEDLHGLREARRLAVANNCDERNHYHNPVAYREIASILRCDLSLIISEAEIGILDKFYQVPSARLHYIPLMRGDTMTPSPGFEERKNFLAIGNFLHAPNADAVRQLKKEIWPVIRASVPGAGLLICGAYPSQEFLAMNDPRSGFLVKGRVDSAGEEMRKARVLLAPLRFGAGLKGKLISAMENGLPSVTTLTGAEGIASTEDWPGFVEDSHDELARSAILLYTRPEAWTKASERTGAVLRKFSPEKHAPAMTEKIAEYSAMLGKIRLDNFLGQLLIHNANHATKYMSKWISLKNTLKNSG